MASDLKPSATRRCALPLPPVEARLRASLPINFRVQAFRLRLFFSNKYAYAQIWRLADNQVVAAASTIEPPVREALQQAGVTPSCQEAAARYGAWAIPVQYLFALCSICLSLKQYHRWWFSGGDHALPPWMPCRVGQLLAERAKQAGLEGVHWQRQHGERYHGKRRALIEAMKTAGLPLV
jgi:ribosomal protein L18